MGGRDGRFQSALLGSVLKSLPSAGWLSTKPLCIVYLIECRCDLHLETFGWFYN